MISFSVNRVVSGAPGLTGGACVAALELVSGMSFLVDSGVSLSLILEL